MTDQIIHKAGTAVTVGEREAVFIASTASVDRHGDVVEQNWDLSSFRKNPVLLFQHDSSSLPIGKVSKVWTDDDKTFARAEGVPEGMDDLADKVWRFIKAGFLNAVSVGFQPIADPEPRRDKDGNWLGYTYPRNALLELSVVAVPANQEALAIARSLHLSKDDQRKLFAPQIGVSAGVRNAKRFVDVQRLRASKSRTYPK